MGTMVPNQDMDDLTRTIAERGDLAHLALFLWASGASGLLVWTLKELSVANKRCERGQEMPNMIEAQTI
jgi:hypothetical protein